MVSFEVADNIMVDKERHGCRQDIERHKKLWDKGQYFLLDQSA